MNYWSTNNDYLQLSHQTAMNRFPKIFETARRLKPDPKRILSFGCSSGDECFTLAEFFPKTEIVGVDIDYPTIQQARMKNKLQDRVFFHTDVGGTGKYDLVTCLMVLFCLDKPVDKDRWDFCVKKVDAHLNEDGLIVVYTSDYDFMGSEVADKYEAIRQWKRIHPRNNKEYFCGYYRKKTTC